MYGKIQKIINALPENHRNHVTIMIDDVSLMEVAAYGSSDHVLDFLHYCHTLTSDVVRNFMAILPLFTFSHNSNYLFLFC